MVGVEREELSVISLRCFLKFLIMLGMRNIRLPAPYGNQSATKLQKMVRFGLGNYEG